MAGEASKIIIVAQAPAADTVQEGVVLQEQPAGGAAHEAGAATHATTEASAQDHSSVFPPFDSSTFGGQILWLAVAFALLYLVMSRVALPRIGGILESRRARIDGDLKEADRLRQETDRAIQTYEAALAEARANAHTIAEETRTAIRSDIEMKRKTVEAELATKLSGAEARISETKAAALTNVGSIAADTLQALMAQLTGPVTEKQASDAVSAVAGDKS